MSISERLLLFLSRSPDSGSVPLEEKQKGKDALGILTRVYPDFASKIKAKRVVDFGCGAGNQALALAENYDCFVLGIDTNKNTLQRARENASASAVDAEKLEFVELATDEHRGKFDVVISQNSFEHFPDPGFILQEMKSLLKDDGVILLTFGPPWYAPYGSHMQFFCKLPWLNLLFSEQTVMKVRSRFRSDGASTYEEVESGLNRMSVGKFERLIGDCGLEVVEKKYECVKGMNFLASIPLIRELFVNHISVVLARGGLC